HQTAVAASSEAGRQLHDHVSVDRPSAVLQHPLLLTQSYFLPTPSGAKALPWETLGGIVFSYGSSPIGGGALAAFRGQLFRCRPRADFNRMDHLHTPAGRLLVDSLRFAHPIIEQRRGWPGLSRPGLLLPIKH